MPKTRTSFAKGNPHRFKPGQSANPAGRPKVIDDIHVLARQHAPEAIDGLVEFMRQREDPQLAMSAMIARLDRGYGRPPVAVYAQVNGQIAVGGIDRPPTETLEQWLERRRRTLQLDVPPPQDSAPPPNGEPAAPVAPAEHAPPRAATPPAAFGSNAANSAGSAGPAMTEQQAEWLRRERTRLGIEPDPNDGPNPRVKR